LRLRWRQIRQREGVAVRGGRRAVYIIAMTANVMQGDRERCLDAGMSDYIAKPTRTEDLHAALERCQSTIAGSEAIDDRAGLIAAAR
jgi:two-component system, sensor histidine kinase and response regulator